VLRDVSAERFVEATVESESVRVRTAEMSEDVVTEEIEFTAEAVVDVFCELKLDTSSREYEPT
jgi:hypothetical protein